MGDRVSTVPRTILTVLEDIAVALEPLTDEIPGLQVVPYLNANPTPPSIDIYPGSPFQTGAGFGLQSIQLWFTIRARVSTADHNAGQMLLLRMLDPSDPASIEVAIADSATVVPEGVSDYGFYTEETAANGRLLGCEWRVSTFL
jgi:hypothetical protein